MRDSHPQLVAEPDMFAWTVIRMGGVRAEVHRFRDGFRLEFFGGQRNISHTLASFVRRRFIQINVTYGNKVEVVFPGEAGWRTGD